MALKFWTRRYTPTHELRGTRRRVQHGLATMSVTAFVALCFWCAGCSTSSRSCTTPLLNLDKSDEPAPRSPEARVWWSIHVDSPRTVGYAAYGLLPDQDADEDQAIDPDWVPKFSPSAFVAGFPILPEVHRGLDFVEYRNGCLVDRSGRFVPLRMWPWPESKPTTENEGGHEGESGGLPRGSVVLTDEIERLPRRAVIEKLDKHGRIIVRYYDGAEVRRAKALPVMCAWYFDTTPDSDQPAIRLVFGQPFPASPFDRELRYTQVLETYYRTKVTPAGATILPLEE